MAEYLFFDTLSNQLRKTIRFYDPFSEYKSPTHYQVLKWIFCLKVLWKNLCFHVKNENNFHPNQLDIRFSKDFESHWQIGLLYVSRSSNLSSNPSGREINHIPYFLFWIQARIAHLVANRLGTEQGAASFTVTAKLSWRRHFF